VKSVTALTTFSRIWSDASEEADFTIRFVSPLPTKVTRAYAPNGVIGSTIAILSSSTSHRSLLSAAVSGEMFARTMIEVPTMPLMLTLSA